MKANNKRIFWVMFFILFGISMVMHSVINNTWVYYDSDTYWALGKACGWDVRNIPAGYRGYVLPYIFSMCYKLGMMLGGEFLGYRVITSLVFSFTFTFLFVYIAMMLGYEYSNQGIHVCVGGGICGLLFLLFFRGILIYPLSDFWAFSLSLLSIIILHIIVGNNQKMYLKAFWAFALGICLYASYNIRTIYLFLLIACFCVLVVWQMHQKKWLQLIVTTIGCFFGMVICAVPQMIMNHNLNGTYSWKVQTGGLMMDQISWGIWMERYATYVGDSPAYTGAAMYFADKTGLAILNSAQIADIFESVGRRDFIKMVLHHPLDFIGIYVRHMLNMLYPVYPDVYIQDVTRDKTLYLILFYTILFIAIINFVHSFRVKADRLTWLILILLPCICILPGAVEIRFFIALHVLINMYAVLGIRGFINQLKENKIIYMIIYVVGFLLYIAYAGMLFSTATGGDMIINP